MPMAVPTNLKTHDPVHIFRHGRQQDNRQAGVGAQVPAQAETVFARHHDVQDHQINSCRFKRASCRVGISN